MFRIQFSNEEVTILAAAMAHKDKTAEGYHDVVELTMSRVRPEESLKLSRESMQILCLCLAIALTDRALPTQSEKDTAFRLYKRLCFFTRERMVVGKSVLTENNEKR
jgi:hypothetical protein